MTQCPCGSQKEYLACCGLFIEKHHRPENPESLMRSRYSAYTLTKIDYIKATMCGKSLEGFDELEAANWAKQVQWSGLQVVKSYIDEQNAHIAYVEFIASYWEQGKKNSLHELSKFEFINDQWFYTEGCQPQVKTKIKKTTIARNSLCPCGSQKKFKNCHGK